MPGVQLTQGEADALIALEKWAEENFEWLYPRPGDKFSISLTSPDSKENFLLDVNRNSIKFSKATYQNRARKVVVLLRLDIDGGTHRNPNHEIVPCPHLHIYREGYETRWAVPLVGLESKFPDTRNLERTLQDFMSYCNIVRPPRFVSSLRGLFR